MKANYDHLPNLLYIGNQFFWDFKFYVLNVYNYNTKIFLTEQKLVLIFTDKESSKMKQKGKMHLPKASVNIKRHANNMIMAIPR